VTSFRNRTDGSIRPLPTVVLCDGWLVDGQRLGDVFPVTDERTVLGRWPDELETDAAVRLMEAVGGTPSFDDYARIPPVAQKLAERARPQRLDLEIERHLQHLQHVCHRPALLLRVEDERLPTSRARRTPVRAVADLVSHPGDWEHRTLRSIQPSRVLARQIEDEWNLYENRVAARLVDNLLAYAARRLEELRKIQETLEATRDYSKEVSNTSFRRARRIAVLWSNTLESRTEAELERTTRRLELAQRDLQALLDTPLYKRVPRRQSVAVALKPTNILVNDPHYRKVAALWRAWADFGHRRHETQKQRAERRQREAHAWDSFVRHLVVRSVVGLGWAMTGPVVGRWRVSRVGWASVDISVDVLGVITLATSTRTIRILPICANLAGANPAALLAALQRRDGDVEVVVAHVGRTAELTDIDRASGWSFSGRAVLFGCSPWAIDTEERMARLLHGWLSRSAFPSYPIVANVAGLPAPPRTWGWMRYEEQHLVGLRAPDEREVTEATAWANARAMELERVAQRARTARQSIEVAPLNAVRTFPGFVREVSQMLTGLNVCPVCHGEGLVEPRPGKKTEGSDATWWAICPSCESEWGSRHCSGCGYRFHALEPKTGLDAVRIAGETGPGEWPDKVFGRDVWAQPCSSGAPGEFRCPACGACSRGECRPCRRRVGEPSLIGHSETASDNDPPK